MLTVGLWIYVIVMACMLLFAVFSNGLVVYCVCRHRGLRTVTNVLIGILAISDMLLAGVVMPQKLHDISHEDDYYEGDIVCKVVNYCLVFSITSSIYTLVCISFERRRAIIYSNRPQLTLLKLRWIVPAVWMFALVVSIPTIVEFQVNNITVYVKPNVTVTIFSCGSQHRPVYLTIINAIFLILVSYVLPVVLMFKNYLQVAFFVWKRGRQVSPGVDIRQGTYNIQVLRSRVKIVKLLVLVAVIFALSWLPFFVMLLYAKITSSFASDDASSFVNLFLNAMATFSTAYNVILYVIFNPSFRAAIQDTLRCKPRALQSNVPKAATSFNLKGPLRPRQPHSSRS